MLFRTTQDGWVMVESFDKSWSTKEGNGKPLQYSCLKNPMNSNVIYSPVRLKGDCCTTVIVKSETSIILHVYLVGVVESHSYLEFKNLSFTMKSQRVNVKAFFFFSVKMQTHTHSNTHTNIPSYLFIVNL